MSGDSGSENPGQRTVAELLAQYGDGTSRPRRRRRRAEDSGETAPQAIIDRVTSDSGPIGQVAPETREPGGHRPAPGAADVPPAGPPPALGATPSRPAEQGDTLGPDNYWSRRFGTAEPGGGPRPPQPMPPDDMQPTIQQPAVPIRRPSSPQRPAPPSRTARPGPAQHEPRTEQIAPVRKDPYDVPDSGELDMAGAGLSSPPAGFDATDLAEISAEDQYDPYSDVEQDSGADDDAESLPAHRRAKDASAEEKEASRSTQGWLVFSAELAAASVAGAGVWLGFRWLWVSIPVAALVASLIATGCLVLVARKFVRSDDLQTILLPVLVGLACTVSPVALLLVDH